MKLWLRHCRHWGWQFALAGALTIGAATARADDWGNWPVPWPPAGSTNPPTTVPPPAGGGVTPPGDTVPPAGTGQPPPTIPPTITPPPPAGSQPPVAAESPPEVPISPSPSGSSSPEPASAVLGLFGVSAGLMAWRRKRAG